MKITFYSPGTMISETNVLDIYGSDINSIIKKATQESTKITQRYGATPYMFRIDGDSKNYFLPHNKVELYNEIKQRNDPKNSILISNMKYNHWKAILTTTKGWKSSQPFNDEDCLLNENGEIILRGYEADINFIRTKKLERILKK